MKSLTVLRESLNYALYVDEGNLEKLHNIHMAVDEKTLAIDTLKLISRGR